MKETSSVRHALIALGASLVAGVALWLSRGSLDLAGSAAAPERVAMLPAWSQLLGLIVLSMLVMSAIGSLLQRRDPAPAATYWSPALADTLMPLFGLGFLVLPYLPYVADWLPAVRILAGPLRFIVWGLVIGQVFWALGSRLMAPHRGADGSKRRIFGPVAIAVVTAAASAALFSQLSSTPHFAPNELARGGFTPLWLWALVAVSAITAACIWTWARALTGSPAAATAAWTAICLSPPFLFNSLAVYPEGLAALGVVIIGTLSYLYRDSMPSAVLYVLGLAAGIGAWIFLTRGDLSRFDSSAFPVGAAGLLTDQEYGLFAYAPVFLAAIVALGAMLRDRTVRAVGGHIVLACVSFLVLAACIDPWWSKSAMPGRLILPVFPLLAIPLAWSYERTADRPLSRAAIQLLALVGIVLTITLAVAVQDAPLPQEADGSSSVLQWMSQTWQLFLDAPSFVAREVTTATIRTLVWVGAFVVFGALARGRGRLGPGSAAFRAGAVAAVVWIAAVSMSAAIPIEGREARFDPEGRVIFPMLETFDPVARPIAVRYNPVSLVTPQDLPPLFSLLATPGQRRDRQPVRVLLNARFRLPAGEYIVDLRGSDRPIKSGSPSMALQLGRDGMPVETWPLALAPRAQWQHRFQVPVDAQFVGFRAPRQVELGIAQLRLTPVNVVETRRRFPTPVVRSAASYSAATVFFHDAEAYPEPEGFWVKGRSTAYVTLAKKAPANAFVTLMIHSGAQPNVVTLSTGRWTQHVELVPGVTNKVAVPSDATEQFIPLTIAASDGFVPAEVEPGNRDRRLLGAWIAFSPDDMSRTSAAP